MAKKPTFGDIVTALGRNVADGPARSTYQAGRVGTTPEMVNQERQREEAAAMQREIRALANRRRERGVMGEEDVLLRMMASADADMPLREFFAQARQEIKGSGGAAQMTQRGRVAR